MHRNIYIESYRRTSEGDRKRNNIECHLVDSPKQPQTQINLNVSSSLNSNDIISLGIDTTSSPGRLTVWDQNIKQSTINLDWWFDKKTSLYKAYGIDFTNFEHFDFEQYDEIIDAEQTPFWKQCDTEKGVCRSRVVLKVTDGSYPDQVILEVDSTSNIAIRDWAIVRGNQDERLYGVNWTCLTNPTIGEPYYFGTLSTAWNNVKVLRFELAYFKDQATYKRKMIIFNFVTSQKKG